MTQLRSRGACLSRRDRDRVLRLVETAMRIRMRIYYRNAEFDFRDREEIIQDGLIRFWRDTPDGAWDAIARNDFATVSLAFVRLPLHRAFLEAQRYHRHPLRSINKSTRGLIKDDDFFKDPNDKSLIKVSNIPALLGPDIATTYENGDMLRQIDKAIGRLAPSYRLLFELRLQDVAPDEIARRIGTCKTTVYERLRAARQIIREAVA